MFHFGCLPLPSRFSDLHAILTVVVQEMVERYKAEQRKNAARIATAVRNVYAAHRM
jgi:hypothetical protein